MKIAILTCSTGGGHDSAGLAIQEQLQSRGAQCQLINALDFMPRLESDVISKGHVFVYKKAPKLYGVGYRFEEKHPPKTIVHVCNAASAKLYPALLAQGFDCAVCVHVFPALMLSHVRQTEGHCMPCYFVATDYTCSPGVNMTQMDGYFIPRGMTGEFVQSGLPEGRLSETGIPVHASCYEQQTREDARAALGLEPSKRQVVLSCGSMGCGPMRPLAVVLADVLPRDTELTVLCGSNRRLRRELSFLIRQGRVRVLGYTDQMPLWLHAADLLLSKPGGLTSTEAMTIGVPFVCIHAVPGCESRNRQYFVRSQLAVTADHVLGLVEQTHALLDDPERCAQMVAKQRATFAHPAADQIAQQVLAHLVSAP
jgi:processive 1,2-diacylglycerol beta-glucosyltransferase